MTNFEKLVDGVPVLPSDTPQAWHEINMQTCPLPEPAEPFAVRPPKPEPDPILKPVPLRLLSPALKGSRGSCHMVRGREDGYTMLEPGPNPASTRV